jgi:putative aldouronate transport system substrate-binding protein
MALMLYLIFYIKPIGGFDMKKLLVTLLAASMCVSMLAGCSSSTSDDSTATDESSDTTSTATSESSEPTGDVELKDFTILGDDATTYMTYETDMEEFPAFQALRALMEAKGINLVMEYVQDDQYLTTLQTRFAAQNNIPMYASMYEMTETDVLALANQGVLLDVNDLLEAGDGTAKKFFNEDTYGSVAKQKVMTPEGNMWWVPNIYVSIYENGEYVGAGTNCTTTIRQDWLDMYDLEIPTTLDEFTNALKTFNENDPSGSGAGVAGMNAYSYNPCSWYDAIANWFGLVRGMVSFNWDEDLAISPWHQDTVKDYLTYINSLSNQGLYDPEMVGSNDTLRTKISNNQVGGTTLYALATTYEPLIETAFKAEGGGALYADIYPITAVEGVTPLLPLEDPIYVWDEFVFTTQLTDEALGAAFLDVYYSDEHIEIINYGVEGVNYEVVNGEKQWLTYSANEEGGDSVQFEADVLNKYLQEKADQRLSYGKILYSRTVTADMTYYDLWKAKEDCYDQIWCAQKGDYQNATIDYGHWTSCDPSGVMATASSEETEIVNDIYNDLSTASQSAVSALVLGNRSLDEIDTIVEELDAIGLSDIEEVYQARYNRFKGIE